MGAGKSTVGQQLAREFDWPFRDLDTVIEKATGRSIPEIFTVEGEDTFREWETRCLRKESLKDPPFVLATGGGAPEREVNRIIMAETGVSIYLNVDFNVLYERIGDDENRPKVDRTKDSYRELKNLWERRQPFYEEADLVLELTNEPPEAMVRKLADRLAEN